jgi:hypothetical protein
VQLFNAIVIGGRERRCTYNPPLEIIHSPIRVESFPRQETGALCRGTVDVTVLGRQSVRDANGRTWPTWVIEIASKNGSQTDQEKHWFSPELGRDIRSETATEKIDVVDQTAQLLRSYPGSE